MPPGEAGRLRQAPSVADQPKARGTKLLRIWVPDPDAPGGRKRSISSKPRQAITANLGRLWCFSPTDLPKRTAACVIC